MKLTNADKKLLAGEPLLAEPGLKINNFVAHVGHGNNGCANTQSKLNPDRVRHIRAHPEMDLKELGRIHDVVPQTIYHVRKGSTWNSVEPGAPEQEYS